MIITTYKNGETAVLSTDSVAVAAGNCHGFPLQFQGLDTSAYIKPQ